MTAVQFAILGPVEVTAGEARLNIGGPRTRAVLARLIVAANHVVAAETLAGELWPDLDPGPAVANLRVRVAELRRVFRQARVADRLVTRTPGYVLVAAPDEVDAARFDRLTAEGRTLLAAGDAAGAAGCLAQALGLWRGPPLGGVGDWGWARAEAARLGEARLAAVECHMQARLDCGEASGLTAELEALTAEYPLRERLWALRMLALYRCGRQAEALSAYQRLRTILVEDLGIDPGADVRQLHQQILAQDPGLAVADPGRAVPVLAARPRVVPQGPTNLPAQVSSFIGRDGELAAVRRLVTTSRLVTLTGAGGVGKTRLGLQVAAGLLDGFPEGVWFADLAPLGDADLVAVTVANVLGIREEPGRPLSGTLIDAVGQGSPLVLLDNCEHVLDACAKLADALLRNCPNLALLATSREPLGIDGERVHRVPSLSIPAGDDGIGAIGTSEAVRLFTDRAVAQGVPLAWDEPTAVVVGRICRRLDGVPLALELAAARLRAMPVTELDARLDERFALLTGGSRAALPRQRTLRAMVDWSWELLNPAERAVLARLSVFAGGFGLAAAEAVAAGPDVPPGEVAGHLGALVDKSLVQFGDTGTGPGRYRLLDTVRQYAAAQLDVQGSAAADAARIAHRDYYLALAEAAAAHLIAHDQAAWLDRLDAELGNLRAAIAFSQTQADPAHGLRLTAPLRVYWMIRGHAAEGAGALRALLDAPAAQEATLPRARALATAAYLLDRTGAYAIAGQYCDEALAIARAAGNEYLIADLLCELGFLLLHQGQTDTALPLIEQGLGLARHLGVPDLTGRLLAMRSFALDVCGDLAGVARDAAESLWLFRQAGNRIRVGGMLGDLGLSELAAGDLDTAHRHLAESLEIARALNDRDGIVFETFNLGLAEYLGGSPGAAEALFAESLDLARRMGMRSGTAYALLGLAMAGHGGADPGWSARLHGAAVEALADLGETIEPLEARLADLDRQRLRAAMGADAFETEYTAGRTLTPEQIVDLALSKRA
jgi:predicted ATPase/DNA-binding SARP family transcriptional activator